MSEEYDRQPTYRSAKISNVSIELTEEDPLERLKQFCAQGSYRYNYVWDAYQNGIMCELDITYFLNPAPNSKRTLVKEVRFVSGTDVQYAKKVLAAVLLERLGLGASEMCGEEETEQDEAEIKMREIASKSMDFAMTALQKMLGATKVEGE